MLFIPLVFNLPPAFHELKIASEKFSVICCYCVPTHFLSTEYCGC